MVTYEYSIIINGTRLPKSHIVHLGNFHISDNGIRSVSGQSVLHVESDFSGYTEVLITPDYAGITEESGVFFRGTDQDNGFYLLNQPSTGTVRLVQLIAGVIQPTNLIEGTGTVDSGAPRVLKAVYEGTQISIYENDIQIGSTVTSSFNQTGTLSGLILGTELVSADNFTSQKPLPKPKTVTFGLPVEVQNVSNLYWSIARVSLDRVVISGQNLDTSATSITFVFEDTINVTNGENLVLIITNTETVASYEEVIGWSTARVAIDGYQGYIEGFGKKVNATGAWQAFTGYYVNDSWQHPNGNWYLTVADYTSGTTPEVDVDNGCVIGYVKHADFGNDLALNKVFRFPDNYLGDASTEIPVPEAGKILAWDQTGSRLVNIGEGINGDTIFEVFQYSSDNGVTDAWHETFNPAHGDKWRRHATSTNGAISEWSLGYNLFAEDGNPGDTIYIEYRYSTDAINWHSVFEDGDIWRSERTVTNGVPSTDWSAAARIRGSDGDNGEITEIAYEYSIDGLGVWHSNFSTGDHYRRERVEYFYTVIDRDNDTPYFVTPWSDATKIVPVVGEDYGYKQSTVYLYQKSQTRPNAPTATITYNFLTLSLTGLTEGWLAEVPDGKFDLWIAVASVWSLEDQDVINPNEWVVEKLSAAGVDGINGAFTSFIYRNDTVEPNPVPDEGSYDGVNEVIPTGWTDNLTNVGANESTYVATARYIYDDANSVWTRAGYSAGVSTGWSAVRSFAGFAGDTIYIEYEYSADNTTWHSDYLETDYFRRERTITISSGVVTEGTWSAGKRVRLDGEPAEPPVKGVDYFDGVDGSFVSYVYKLSDTSISPLDNTVAEQGSYDGATEVIPVGWSDNPVYSATVKTQVSTCRYKLSEGSWARNPDWSASVQYLGQDGAEGLKGDFTSFVFRNATTKPEKPTDGSFDGTDETMPTLPEVWTDEPEATTGTETTWVSKATYVADANGTWDRKGLWSVPVQWKGNDGYKSASVNLYIVATVEPTPPTADTTYTFATGVVSGTLQGWSNSVPDNTEELGKVWVTHNTAFAPTTNTTDTLSTANWSVPAVLTTNGSNGLSTFTLVNKANCEIVGNTVTKTTGTDLTWNAGAHSLEKYVGATVSFTAPATNKRCMVGLNDTPSVSAGFNDMECAIYLNINGVLEIYIGTTSKYTGTYAVDDVFTMTTDGELIRCLKNGVEFYNTLAPADTALGLDISLYDIGSSVENITFSASGLKGNRGPGRYSIVGTAWSDALADTAVNGVKQIGDDVTIYSEPPDAPFTETRTWSGDETTGWVKADVLIDGNLVVNGTAIIDQLFANEVLGKDIEATGSIKYESGIYSSGLGGAHLIHAKKGNDLIFSVNTDGSGQAEGSWIRSGSLSYDAFDGEVAEYIRSQLGVTAPETGGTKSTNFTFTGNTGASPITLPTLKHGSKNVSITFSGGGGAGSGGNNGAPSFTATVRKNGELVTSFPFTGSTSGVSGRFIEANGSHEENGAFTAGDYVYTVDITDCVNIDAGMPVNGTFRVIEEGSGGVSSYSLPTASASELGGVKVGTGLEIQSDVLSVSAIPKPAIPKHLLIYYGYPIAYQGLWSIPAVVEAIASKYDTWVCGDTYQQPTQEVYSETVDIIAGLHGRGVKIYGYIPMGQDATEGHQALTLAEMKTRVDQWATLGIAGIFLDEFGFDYKVPRQLQIDIINYIYTKGMVYCANAWTWENVSIDNAANLPASWPAGDWRRTDFETYNPNNLPLPRNPTDAYLMENWGIDHLNVSNVWNFLERAELTLTSNPDNMEIWAVGVMPQLEGAAPVLDTTFSAPFTDPAEINKYVQVAGIIYGLNTVGVNGYYFGSGGVNTFEFERIILPETMRGTVAGTRTWNYGATTASRYFDNVELRVIAGADGVHTYEVNGGDELETPSSTTLPTADEIGSIKVEKRTAFDVDTLGTYISAKNESGYTGSKPADSHNGVGTISLQTHSGNYYSQLALDTKQNTLWMRSADDSATWSSFDKILSEANHGAASDFLSSNKFNGAPIAAYYLTDGNGASGIKIRLPYNANSQKMLAFTVRVYQGYEHYDVVFSGYLYSSDNQWYKGKALLSSSTNSSGILVKMGRDADGRAYVWLAAASYRGVAVMNIVGGYRTADWNTGWEISESDTTPDTAVNTTIYPPYSPHNPQGSVTGNAGTVTNGVYTNTTQSISGLKTFNNMNVDGAQHWRVSSADTANQRADCRDDGTFSRLHWYGEDNVGDTSNFRHAWWDGGAYINVTVSSGVVDFTGVLEAHAFKIRTAVAGVGASISFSDQIGAAQKGALTYYHEDSKSYGGGNAFIFSGSETSTVVLADGYLTFKSGLYIKPASGTNSLGTKIIDGSGNITGAAISGTSVTYTSDIRVKYDICEIENALDKVEAIGGQMFNRSDMNDERQAGVIAQNVQAVLPEAVYTDEEGKLSVSAPQTIGLLYAALKEVSERLKVCEDELRRLK